MTRRTTAALLLPLLPLLSLAACKDAAGPGPTLTVRLTAVPGAPVLGTGQEGVPTIECTTRFDAVAEGSGTGKALWTGGVVRYFTGPERTAPADSIPFDGADIREALGTDGITPGQTQHSAWTLVGALPYEVEMELRYEQGRRGGSAKARAACGPVPSASVQPPAISGATLVHAPGTVQPGDSVTLSWTASAAAGLWETGIIVAGVEARIRFGEGSAATSSRSVRVEVPHVVNVPMTVQVYAVDAFGRTATAPLATPTVQDVTPPLVEMAQAQQVPERTAIWLRGQFGIGDVIPLHLLASDNFGLTYVVYGVGEARDSVQVTTGRFHNGEVRLPVKAAWAGRTDFFVQVRDAGGNLSPRLDADGMSFYPVRAAQAVHASLPDVPGQAVIDERRARGWVRFPALSELRAYSLPGLGPVRNVALPGPGSDMDLSVTHDTLVVAVGASLALVDARAADAVTVVPLPGVQRVTGLRVSAAGEAVIVAEMETGRFGLLAYRLATRELRVLSEDLQVWGNVGEVARSLDRRRMVIGRGCVYDAVSHVTGPCAGGSIFGIGTLAGDHTGARWALDGRVYDAELNPVLEIPRVDHANGAVLSASGDRVIFNTQDGPLRVRVSDGRYVERFGGTSVHEGLVAAADGLSVLAWGFHPAPRLSRIAVP